MNDMSDKEYREMAQKRLDEYQEAMKTPLDRKNIYLGMSINDIEKEEPNEYLVVEWNDGISSLIVEYPDYHFYSTFFIWEGVEIFTVNLSENKKVTILKINEN